MSTYFRVILVESEAQNTLFSTNTATDVLYHLILSSGTCANADDERETQY